ncbi:phage tail protein [Photobacterium salinisoli]|uniref:phage tail protein n=1 Tax=Photobacterium salinisoli TaxID=1616783 RepID=UPI000EA16234|nr:phage tail protein [Photobacterium salinisoli]
MADIPESQQQYGSILTIAGENAEQNGKLLKKPIEFTHIAIGDANDTYVQPDRTQSALVHEIARLPVNVVDVVEGTQNTVPTLVVEALLPDTLVNVVIREFAVVAKFNGNTYLHAVGNCARVYVPAPQNNGGETNEVAVQMTFTVTSVDPIVMINPNVVTASREYVNKQMAAHLAAVDPHPQYGKKEKFHFSNHFQRIAILLVPYAEASTRFEESFVIGRLIMARGSSQFSERLGDFEISVKSSYNETSFTMMVYRRGWRLEFCSLEYEGQKWLALYDTNAEWFNSQDAHVTFLGERGMKEPSYDKDNQFKIISFASSSPSTPASNPEVFETIVPLETHNPQDARGYQFYSQSYPPVVGNVQGLPEALGTKLPVNSLVGSIVEFSTDQPRTGYVKAQRVELSRIAYPKLWSVVQGAQNLTDQSLIDADPQTYAGHYGTGDGVSTFTTPDYHLGHYRRGAEANDVFASTLDSAVEFHNHGLPTSAASTPNPVTYGMPDSAWVAVDHFNYVLPGGGIVVTADVGQEAAGQRKGNFDEVTRPKTLINYVYIFHGESA